MIYNLSMLIKKWIPVALCFRFFLITELKSVKYFFSAWFSDHGLLVKNDQQWKTFRVINNMTIFRKKEFSPCYHLWRHNNLYLTRYLVFPAFWSHSVLFKIGQYTKNNLMIYNSSMFGTKIFVVTLNYDVIRI